MIILWKPSRATSPECTVCNDYVPTFSPTPSVDEENGIYLNCGELILLSGGTLGNYLIEWKIDSVNGRVVFTTGNSGNTDASKESSHPFENEIVEAGELFPVIKYIQVDGIYYSPYINEYVYSPDLLNCIQPPSITVNPITCGLVTSGYTGDYDFRLIREVNQGEDSRTLKWDLAPTTNYLAWGFDTVNVADGILISYCTSGDSEGVLLDYVIYGVNLISDWNPVDYPNNPIIVDETTSVTGVFKYVTEFTGFTYQTGDYLKILITGNTEGVQQQTKWTLYCKCFDDVLPLIDVSPMGTKISATTVNWVEGVSCIYLFEYENEKTFGSTDFQTSFLKKYFYVEPHSVSGPYSSVGGSGYLEWRASVRQYGPSLFDCLLVSGITIQKQATGVLYSFESGDDYDKAVSDIVNVYNSSHYSDYLSATPQDFAYYSFYRLMWFDSTGTCDDTSKTSGTWNIPFHGSNIIYNSGDSTIFFEFPTPSLTNEITGYTASTCDTRIINIDALINGFNDVTGLTDGTTHFARIRPFYIISYGIPYERITSETDKTIEYGVKIKNIVLNNIYNPLDYGYVYVNDGGVDTYIGYQIKDKISLANCGGGLCCWELERDKFLRTKDLGDLGTLELIDSGSIGTGPCVS